MLKILSVTIIILMQICIFAQTDPNTDPNWDWINGDYPQAPYPSTQYKMYVATSGGIQAVPRNAPWGQGNAWIGLQDMKREDGWVLVARDFGTPSRAIFALDQEGSPYFILYNKYRGLLRFFILVRTNEDFSSGAIQLRFNNVNTFKTATLTHLKPRAYATDKLDMVKDNVASALTTPMNDNWAWADFPMAYDPTIVATTDGAWMDFQVIGTTEGNIKMSGTGTGINGTQKNVRDFMTGADNGAVTLSQSMPAQQETIDLGALTTKVTGTASSWAKWKTTIIDFEKKLPILTDPSPISLANDHLKLLIENLANSWFGQGLPFIGGVVGLVDYFVSGGKKTNQEPQPTYFGFNLSLAGTIKTDYILPNPKRIQAPSSKLNPNIAVFGSTTPIVYNNNFGVLNLTTTPLIKYKSYTQSRYGSQVARGYNDFIMYNDLNISVNPAAGLVVDSVRAWLVVDPTSTVNIQNPSQDIDLNTLASWTQAPNPKLQLESSVDGRFTFRSIPVAASALKYQRIQAPYGSTTSDVTVKIKAVLHRADDPNAQPIVLVTTYEPDLQDAGTGNWPAPVSIILTAAQFPEGGGPGATYEVDGVNVGSTYNNNALPGQTIKAISPNSSWVFYQWSDGNTTNPRTINSALNVNAIFKFVHRSNIATAFSNNSQRKLVRTRDNWLHQVYESMGRVWLEHSTDNGTTWVIGNNGQPLDNGAGKCPSIDWHYNTVDPNNTSYNSVIVAYQQQSGTLYTIEYAIFKYSNGSYVRQGQSTAGPLYTEPSGGDQYASVNANPNITWGNSYYFALTFERKSTAGSMQPGIYWKYGVIYENGIPPSPSSYPPPTAPIKITGTNSSSINASVFLNKLSTDNSFFDIIYQQSTDNIYDIQLSCSWNGSTWSTSQLTSTISRGSGFKNYQSSLVHMQDNNIRACWIRDLYGGGSSTPYYVNAVYWNSANPNVFTYAGNMVNSISLNLRDDNANSYYAYAQNTNNSNWQNFASNGTTTTTLSTTGRQIQLSNGASSSAMYASAFYPVSLPYYFITSGSLGSLAKSSDRENTYGRGVVLGTDQFGFSYSMKSLKAGKNSIKFVEIPESKAKKAKRTGVEQLGLDSLNTFLLSEPFTIEEGMTISFSEGAGFNAPGEGAETSASLLADKDYSIDRKIELIEENSDKSIAVIKQSRFTPQDKNILDLKAADVTITGKKARKVRLKITLEANVKGIEGMLVNEYNTINENILSKLTTDKITLLEKGEIASYVLEQNYPNPFNPKTIISYQLPKDGHVTLKVYDILGKEITTLVSEYKSQGRYSVEFDASNLSSGTYIYELRVNDYTSVKKLLLLK